MSSGDEELMGLIEKESFSVSFSSGPLQEITKHLVI